MVQAIFKKYGSDFCYLEYTDATTPSSPLDNGSERLISVLSRSRSVMEFVLTCAIPMTCNNKGQPGSARKVGQAITLEKFPT